MWLHAEARYLVIVVREEAGQRRGRRRESHIVHDDIVGSRAGGKLRVPGVYTYQLVAATVEGRVFGPDLCHCLPRLEV